MKSEITNNTGNTKKNTTNIIGIILLVLGSLLLAKNMGVEFPWHYFGWPTILIIIGLISGVKNEFRKPGAYILIWIGAMFQLDRIIPYFEFDHLIIPGLLIGLGLHAILGRRRHDFNSHTTAANQASDSTNG